MLDLEERRRRFALVARDVRVAFATAAGERILPVYEKAWVGDHIPEIAEAIELGWRAALRDAPSRADLERCVTSVRDAVELYNEESIAVLSRCATISLRVLQCIQAYVVLLEAVQSVDMAIERPLARSTPPRRRSKPGWTQRSREPRRGRAPSLATCSPSRASCGRLVGCLRSGQCAARLNVSDMSDQQRALRAGRRWHGGARSLRS